MSQIVAARLRSETIIGGGGQLPWLAAAVITLPILLKIVLMLVATCGMIAPAATATNPAIRAYSIRSWPRRSCHRFFIDRLRGGASRPEKQ
jgi:hypothetical protein